MNVIRLIQDFNFTASGGMAIYFILCAACVAIIGLIEISKFFIKSIKKYR